MSEQIVTINDFLTFTNQSALSNEAQVQEAITAAIKYAEAKCDRTFVVGSASHAWEFSGKGGLRLYTPNAPILTVTKIEYWNGTAFEEVDSGTHTDVIDGLGDYIFFREQYIWEVGICNWKVTYTYGYTELPADLKRAILLTALAFSKTNTRDITIRSQSDGEQSFTYSNEPAPPVPDEADSIFYSYRRWF